MTFLKIKNSLYDLADISCIRLHARAGVGSPQKTETGAFQYDSYEDGVRLYFHSRPDHNFEIAGPVADKIRAFFDHPSRRRADECGEIVVSVIDLSSNDSPDAASGRSGVADQRAKRVLDPSCSAERIWAKSAG